MANQLPFGITRAMLAKAFNGDDTLARAFELVIRQVQTNGDISTAAVEATTELADATAVTLSPNAALNNERILAVSDPLALDDEGVGGRIIIGFQFPFTVPTIHALNINLLADTNVTFPPTGTLMGTGSEAPTYANDAAAAAAGYSVGDIYKQPGGVVTWRQV